MPEFKTSDVDEAVILFAHDLYAEGAAEAERIFHHLDQRGIGRKEILHSLELKEDEKIDFLKVLEDLIENQ